MMLSSYAHRAAFDQRQLQNKKHNETEILYALKRFILDNFLRTVGHSIKGCVHMSTGQMGHSAHGHVTAKIPERR